MKLTYISAYSAHFLMDKLKDSFFQAYFGMPVPRIIIRTNTPDYTIIAVNNAYVSAIESTVDTLVGLSLLDLYNEERIGTHGQAILKKALTDAIQTNEPVNIPELEVYPGPVNWWHVEFMPVAELNEDPSYLIITARNVTSYVLSRKELEATRHREQTLHEELAATNEELSAANEELSATVENLRESQESLQDLNNELENRVKERTADLLKTQTELLEHHELLETIVNEVPAGICVLKGPEMVIETVNRKLQQMWARDESIIGKTLLEIRPEIKGQKFPDLLNKVYTTGTSHSNFDENVDLVINETRQTVYRDYSYTPLKNTEGVTHSVLAMTIDVTERTLSRLREQQLLEEQSAINEELYASNEELAATNEELHEAQEAQQKLIETLEESEARFRNLIMDAPVAICVLKGPELIFDAINTECLKILGKTTGVVGKSLREASPELEKQSFLPLLDHVYQTGEPYFGNEAMASFEHSGKMVTGYFNFIYKPLKDDKGAVEGIMIVATEVTDLIAARTERENAETKFGLAIEAAQMGSWHIDPKTKHLHYNTTLAKLYGYEGEEMMTYDQAIAQVTEDCREKLVEEIEKAINDGGVYDVTFTQHRFNDNEIIWLRSLGKITQDEHGNYTIFSGVVMDITELKQDEQRKNDFIGMVSHELKTPLTSLKGYAQILHSRAKKQEDTFAANALTKVTDQVKKMTAMINGFLNISRLESGKIHLSKQHFNIDELIQENIEESDILITTHNIIFGSCASVNVFADRDKIGSVISNMISNAVKYSPEGKDIEIHCELIDKHIQISIKDQGMGIEQKDIPKLFDRFYRVESNQTQLISGFGIGLYLSAEIIRRHHGKIWVESQHGLGSTFFFTLPVTESKEK